MGLNELTEALLNRFDAAIAPEEFIVWIEIESELIRIRDELPLIHASCEQTHVASGALQQRVGHGWGWIV